MQLNDLQPNSGARRSSKRLGRGVGSGLGKTCGKGHKGQKSRAGGSIRPGFEGGQMPLYRRLPKFGFSSRKGPALTLPLARLASLDAGLIDLKLLRAKRIVRSKHGDRVKIVASSEALERPLTISGLALSAGALAALQAAGGSVVAPEPAPESTSES